jgi:hypothetical protein
MQRRFTLKALTAAVALAGTAGLPAFAQSGGTIKVGVLHSLSGTMAISETVLKDTVLMAIDEINAKGGVLGKKLEPVVVDPASNWPLFAEKTKQLLTQDKVAVMFGCWTSVSRKSVLPVVEELNGLLFYPVQYEGEELSKNVFYTGAAPNQQAIPAVEYLMSKEGGGAKRFVLLGTDYVYPRTTNKILRAFLKSKGIAERHRRGVHPVRPQRLPDHHRQGQEVLQRRQEDGGDLHDQRRLQRALLQGTGQRRPEGQGRAGRRLLGGRGRTARRRHQAAGGPPGRLELLHVGQEPDQHRVHQEVGRLRQGQGHRRPQGQAADQRPDGSHLHRRPHVGRPSRRPSPPTPTRSSPPWPARPSRRRPASPPRWTRRTTTCTSMTP